MASDVEPDAEDEDCIAISAVFVGCLQAAARSQPGLPRPPRPGGPPGGLPASHSPWSSLLRAPRAAMPAGRGRAGRAPYQLPPDPNEACLVCGDAGIDKANGTRMGAAGIATFMKASLVRCDGKDATARGRDHLWLHTDCKKRYEGVAVGEQGRKLADAEREQARRRLRSHTAKFEVGDHCIMCGGSVGGRRPQKDVHNVMTVVKFKKTIEDEISRRRCNNVYR